MNRPSIRTVILVSATAAIGVALFMSNQGCINSQITVKKELQDRVQRLARDYTRDSEPNDQFEEIRNADYPSHIYPLVIDMDGKMWVNGNAPWLCGGEKPGSGPTLLDTPGEQRPPIQTMIHRAKTGGGFEQFQWAYADRLESHIAYVQMLGNTNFIVGMVAREQY